MSASPSVCVIPWHCRACHVEWTADALQAQTCWLCNGEARQGNDPASPWTTRAAWLAGADEGESA